jgi:hypothetical protein
LNTDTFANGRVRLFGFDTNFFKDDAFGVGGATGGGGLVDVTESTFLV